MTETTTEDLACAACGCTPPLPCDESCDGEWIDEGNGPRCTTCHAAYEE